MGWTRRQLIDEAYGELALQGFVFDISPEEQQTAMRRLDTMMATWSSRGVHIGYTFSTGPTDASLDVDSGVPLSAAEAVYLNLAIRLAAGMGKTLTAATHKAAREAYATLLIDAAQPPQQPQPGSMPLGAGNKPWRGGGQFTPAPDDAPLAIADDGGLNFRG